MIRQYAGRSTVPPQNRDKIFKSQLRTIHCSEYQEREEVNKHGGVPSLKQAGMIADNVTSTRRNMSLGEGRIKKALLCIYNG